jgi:hypothetical protein
MWCWRRSKFNVSGSKRFPSKRKDADMGGLGEKWLPLWPESSGMQTDKSLNKDLQSPRKNKMLSHN